MPPETAQLNDELTAALSIEDERQRVNTLLALAPSLTEDLMSQTLEALPEIRDENLRAKALAGIAPHLKGDQLHLALTFAFNIALETARSHALGSIAACLPEKERPELIKQFTGAISTPGSRLLAWIPLAPYLPSELKQEAFSTALSMTDDRERSEALIALAPHLPDVWKLKALDSARKISDPFVRVQTLSGLIPALPKPERARTLDEALTLAHELPPYEKAVAFLSLIPLVPADIRRDLFNETLRIARGIPDNQRKIEVLIRLPLTMNLSRGGELGYLREAVLKEVVAISDDRARGDALITLAQSSPAELHNDILKVAMEIKDSRVKSSVVIQLKGITEQEPTSPKPGSLPPPPGEETILPVDQPEDEEPVTDFQREDLSSDAAPPVTPPEPPPPTVDPPPLKRAPRKKKLPPPDAPLVTEPPLEPSPADESVGVKAYLHSDKWTLDDQLNYSLYAEAIAEFILQPDTKPPLAIGVLAPWGQGKTTLMKLIQNQLELKVKGKETANPVGVVDPPETPRVNFEYLRTWLQDPHYKLAPTQLNYPTVWFNAWKYQNSEQLWAGMAYTILAQLVDQLATPIEREKFWLALQAERIDLNAIRRDIHQMIFERMALWIISSLAIAVLGLLLFVAGFAAGNMLLGSGGGAVLLSAVVIPIVKWLKARAQVDKKPLEGKFAQYVRQPTYEGKLGFFHEIETDVQRVFRLLVAPGKPVVVFIDDLDRCSPGTVAQVIEAMNLFLSADFPDCYFVVGMDAQVVAASMEVAYEKLDNKMRDVTRSYGSLGWYFMDKFIQLQFNIPNMTADQRGVYLTKLFGRELDITETLPAAELDNIERQLDENLNNPDLKPEQLPEQAVELSKLRLQRPQSWQRIAPNLVRTSARKLSDDNPALQKYLERYEPFLGVSPRGIKRFANLFRFYSLSQLSRQSQGMPACSPSALARWLVIMLRWPQVVRWIQWEGEAKLSAGTSALNKAEALEEQIVKTANYSAWVKYLTKLDPNHANWMSDRQLYDFLKTPARADEKLSVAVQTGVW